MKKWTTEDSRELYNINGWGTSYFGINEKGTYAISGSRTPSLLQKNMNFGV